MKRVVFGPYIGEFGWELFCWQGHCRALAKSVFAEHEHTVACQPGHEFLYADWCKNFVNVSRPKDSADGWWCQNVPRIDAPGIYEDAVHPLSVPVSYRSTHEGYANYVSQEFVKLYRGEKSPVPMFVCHARTTTKCGTAYRNWSLAKWHQLVLELRSAIPGCRIVFIGHPDQSASIPEAQDCRQFVTANTAKLCGLAWCVIGPSSGPMHLASLCGTKQIVWSDNPSNLERYVALWNPFKTEVDFMHSKDPSVEEVLTKVINDTMSTP